MPSFETRVSPERQSAKSSTTGKKRTIFVVGECGIGKSSLCRYLAECSAQTDEDIEKAKALFTASSGHQGHTTTPAEATFNTVCGVLRIFDTPGLNDTNGRDDQFLVDIVKAMRNVDDCGAVILVAPYYNPRVTGTIQATLKMFHGIIGNDLLGMLTIVLTNADHKRRTKKPTDLDSFRNDLMKKVFQLDHNAATGTVPTFSIDCEPDCMIEGEMQSQANTAQALVNLAFAHEPHNLGQAKIVRTPEANLRNAKRMMDKQLEELQTQLNDEIERQREIAAKAQQAMQVAKERHEAELEEMVRRKVEEHIQAGGREDDGIDGLFWIPPTGARYHRTNGCAGGNALRVNRPEARRRGFSPCGNCRPDT